MRYWIAVLVLLAIVAVMLPVSRAVRTIIGDAQIVFALALLALLARLIAQAIATPYPGPPPPRTSSKPPVSGPNHQ